MPGHPQARGTIDHQPRRIDVGCQICDLESYSLELADRLSERLSLTRVAKNEINSLLGEAKTAIGYQDAAVGQSGLELSQAATDLTQHATARHTNIFNGDERSRRRMIANLVEVRCRDARIFCIHNEYRERIRGTRLAGSRSHQHEIGDRAVSDVELASIENEIVPIRPRIGPDTPDVASRIWFGQTECADAPAFHRRLQEFGLLLGGPEIDDGAESKVLMGEDAGRNTGRRAREFLIEKAAHEQVASSSTNRFGIVDAEIAGLSQKIIYFERKDVVGLGPPSDGREAVSDESSELVTKLHVFVIESEVIVCFFHDTSLKPECVGRRRPQSSRQ